MERLNDAIEGHVHESEPVSGLDRTLHSVQQNDVGVLTSPWQVFSSNQDTEKKICVVWEIKPTSRCGFETCVEVEDKKGGKLINMTKHCLQNIQIWFVRRFRRYKS